MKDDEVMSFMKKWELPSFLKGKFSSTQVDKIIDSCLKFEASEKTNFKWIITSTFWMP